MRAHSLVKKFLGFVLAFTFTLTSSANEESDKSCLFDKTMVMGASISANLMTDIYGHLMAPLIPNRIIDYVTLRFTGTHESQQFHHSFGYGPATYLSMKYSRRLPRYYVVDYMGGLGFDFGDLSVPNPLSSNDIEIDLDARNVVRTGLDYIYAINEGEFSYGRRRRPYARRIKRRLERSSALVGMDMFYFSGGFNDCRYYRNYGGGARGMIRDFIQYTSEQGLPLFLGTVPLEDPEQVFYSNGQNIWIGDVPQVNNPQQISCVNEINGALLAHCTPANNCYLTRLDQIVEQINREGYPLPALGWQTPNVEGQEGMVLHTREQLRPDGLNLSHAGARILTLDMESHIESPTTPPRCRGHE